MWRLLNSYEASLTPEKGCKCLARIQSDQEQDKSAHFFFIFRPLTYFSLSPTLLRTHPRLHSHLSTRPNDVQHVNIHFFALLAATTTIPNEHQEKSNPSDDFLWHMLQSAPPAPSAAADEATKDRVAGGGSFEPPLTRFVVLTEQELSQIVHQKPATWTGGEDRIAVADSCLW